MLTEQLDWEKTDGMMPTIVQHAVSGEVLMHGYMNKEALEKTEATGKAAGDHRSSLVMVFLTAPGRGSRVWYSAGHGIY